MMSTGVKENCHCWEWESPQMPPPLPGKATNHPGQLETQREQEGSGRPRTSWGRSYRLPQNKGESAGEEDGGSAHRNSPLGKIQRAEKGCIRGAWAGIPQVATS